MKVQRCIRVFFYVAEIKILVLLYVYFIKAHKASFKLGNKENDGSERIGTFCDTGDTVDHLKGAFASRSVGVELFNLSYGILANERRILKVIESEVEERNHSFARGKLARTDINLGILGIIYREVARCGKNFGKLLLSRFVEH